MMNLNAFPDRNARISTARQVAAEGMVLLENNGILPLAEGSRLAVFGSAQINFLTGGSGSGFTVCSEIITVPDALEKSGVVLEPTLRLAYKEFCEKQSAEDSDRGVHNVIHFHGIKPEMPLEQSLVDGAAKFTDTAVYVLSRMAGEGQDRKAEKGDYYLTDEELGILSALRDAFRNVIVVLNTAAIVDLSWMENIRPAALILTWLPGQEGTNALADILTGKVNPSGHLCDTIAYRLSDHASDVNFGSWVDGIEDYTGDGNQLEYWGMIGNHAAVPVGETVKRPVGNRWFTEYQENIYVGYRYFTTFGVPVRYPFGYGLSYTNFEITPGQLSYSDGIVRLSVTVRNTGDMAGKQVVQIYCHPAEKNIERPERELVAFGKTPLLQPGERYVMSFEIGGRELSCYSEKEAAWITESGEYEILCGDSCVNLSSAGKFHVEGHIVEQVSNHFELRHTRALNLLSKKDPESTFPKAPPIQWNSGEKMGEIKQVSPFEVPLLPEAEYRLDDVRDGKVSMEDFIGQMDDMELVFLCIGVGNMKRLETFGKISPCVEGSSGHSATIDRLGIPSMVFCDGPAGIRVTAEENKIAYPTASVSACTWNTELIETLGSIHGSDAAESGVDVWLAPAMNIHRHPLCGRNYEYFSEDPYLAGKIAAAFIVGAQKYGISCCPKHFAVNNQETNRFDGVDAVATERTIREIYLRGFEIAVREGNPHCIMTSYNSLNGSYTAARRDLLSDVLRGEWGFSGFVVSDWEGDGPYAMEALQAGNDLLMPGFPGQNRYLLEKVREGSLRRETLVACAENILKAVLSSHGMKN